jgi:H+/Cl- antiporter ClcA
MGAFAPILAFLLEKFLPNILNKGYPVEAIIFSFLGGVFNSIFTAGRNGRSPSLCDNPPQQGGFQFLSVLISAALGLLFGLLAAVILRCFNPKQSINKDRDAWFIDQ